MTTPQKQGLYDPQFEHENCGIGLIVDMKGRKSHDIVRGALEICVNLDHRGGCGCDPITGDGAGIFIQTPDKFFRKVVTEEISKELPPAGDYGVAFLFLSSKESDRINEKKIVEEVRPTKVMPAKPPAPVAQSKPVLQAPMTYKKLLSRVVNDSISYNTNFSSLRYTNQSYFAKENTENNIQRKAIS
mgnify:CR=1 FL=1